MSKSASAPEHTISTKDIRPEQGSSGQGDAPPPYSEPSIPHQTHLPPQPQPITLPQPAHLESQYSSNPSDPSSQWIPPPNMAVARSRALRRFWVAFFWAWVVWLVIGLVIGGGVSDVEGSPGGSGHWDKHGRWREDFVGFVAKGGRLIGLEEPASA